MKKNNKKMKKILVCDDEESILEVLGIILEDNGYKTLLTSSCERILSLVKDFKPDLILLDLWMKSCDGREVVDKINKEVSVGEIPILFISALNEVDQIAKKANVSGYIKKPFEVELLLDKVKEAIN